MWLFTRGYVAVDPREIAIYSVFLVSLPIIFYPIIYGKPQSLVGKLAINPEISGKSRASIDVAPVRQVPNPPTIDVSGLFFGSSWEKLEEVFDKMADMAGVIYWVFCVCMYIYIYICL